MPEDCATFISRAGSMLTSSPQNDYGVLSWIVITLTSIGLDLLWFMRDFVYLCTDKLYGMFRTGFSVMFFEHSLWRNKIVTV